MDAARKEFRSRELSHQLAELLCPPGSPLILQRSAAFQEYFYHLEDSISPIQIVRRLLAAIVLRVLGKEITLIRLQLRVFSIASPDESDRGNVLEAIREAESYQEWCWLGCGQSPRARAALEALVDPELMTEFSALLRRGEIVEHNGVFECPRERSLRRDAVLLPIFAFVYLIGLFGSLSDTSTSGVAFMATGVVTSLACCAWLARTLWARVADVRALAHTANMSRRLRFVPRPNAPRAGE